MANTIIAEVDGLLAAQGFGGTLAGASTVTERISEVLVRYAERGERVTALAFQVKQLERDLEEARRTTPRKDMSDDLRRDLQRRDKDLEREQGNVQREQATVRKLRDVNVELETKLREVQTKALQQTDEMDELRRAFESLRGDLRRKEKQVEKEMVKSQKFHDEKNSLEAKLLVLRQQQKLKMTPEKPSPRRSAEAPTTPPPPTTTTTTTKKEMELQATVRRLRDTISQLEAKVHDPIPDHSAELRSDLRRKEKELERELGKTQQLREANAVLEDKLKDTAKVLVHHLGEDSTTDRDLDDLRLDLRRKEKDLDREKAAVKKWKMRPSKRRRSSGMPRKKFAISRTKLPSFNDTRRRRRHPRRVPRRVPQKKIPPMKVR